MPCRPFRLAANGSGKTLGLWLLGSLCLLAGCGAGAGSGGSGNNISVTITNKLTSIQAGTAAIVFAATVQNDSSNSGVTWTLSANGTSCSPGCGTLSLVTSSTVTYTPPASGPAAPNNQPTLTATSVAKTNKSDSDSFAITAGLVVSITNKFSSVNTGSSPFVINATVQNDPSNSGVTWALTANGAACTSNCGTLSGATAGSVTYQPPSSPSGQLTLTATSLHDPSKFDSFSFTLQTPAITVTIQGKFTSVTAGSSTIFLEANVLNDPNLANDSSNHPAVTWTLTAGNSNCQPACGTLTAVGAAGVQYNPPASVPATPNNSPTLAVTSTADPTKSDSDALTITAPSPISVTVSPITSVLAGASGGITFSAYVQNDFNNPPEGVTWSLTVGGAACPACGTLSNITPTSVTYTPPATVPASPNNQPTLVATSVADPSKSGSDTFTIVPAITNGCAGTGSGQESLLNGHYALLLEGFWSNGSGVPRLTAASFQADGTGKITGGEEDVNDSISPQQLTFTSTGSLYTVGTDHRGCLQITNSGGTTQVFRFSLGGINSGIASRGRLIEFDDSSGTGTGSRGSGILRQQDPNSFVLTALQSQYAFGVAGWSQNNQFMRLVGAGEFTNSGGSLNGVDDLVFSGGITSPDTTGLTGTINPISATTGRTTGKFDIFDWAIYVVNPSELFVVSIDSVNVGTISAGKVIATANSFTASSLSGNYVLHATGNTNGSADVTLQLLSASPGGAQTGTISGNVFSYAAGNGAQTATLTGVTYNVDSSIGRTTVGNLSDNFPVLYLTTPTDGVAAFAVGMGVDALSGVAEAQMSSSLSTGTYTFGTESPADNAVTNKAGAGTISNGGTLSATYDLSNLAGLNPNQNVGATVSLGSNGAGNIGPNTVAVTSGNRLFLIDETAPAVITVGEQ